MQNNNKPKNLKSTKGGRFQEVLNKAFWLGNLWYTWKFGRWREPGGRNKEFEFIFKGAEYLKVFLVLIFWGQKGLTLMEEALKWKFLSAYKYLLDILPMLIWSGVTDTLLVPWLVAGSFRMNFTSGVFSSKTLVYI